MVLTPTLSAGLAFCSYALRRRDASVVRPHMNERSLSQPTPWSLLMKVQDVCWRWILCLCVTGTIVEESAAGAGGAGCGGGRVVVMNVPQLKKNSVSLPERKTER